MTTLEILQGAKSATRALSLLSTDEKNAALLAIAILALQDAELLAKLEAFRKEQTEKVVNTVI